jgi:hypothetical protein
MTRDKFLTVRWNNWLTLAFGLPTLGYAVFGLSTSVMSDFTGFLGMVIFGIIY